MEARLVSTEMQRAVFTLIGPFLPSSLSLSTPPFLCPSPSLLSPFLNARLVIVNVFQAISLLCRLFKRRWESLFFPTTAETLETKTKISASPFLQSFEGTPQTKEGRATFPPFFPPLNQKPRVVARRTRLLVRLRADICTPRERERETKTVSSLIPGQKVRGCEGGHSSSPQRLASFLPPAQILFFPPTTTAVRLLPLSLSLFSILP